jgi:hypothetical protein
VRSGPGEARTILLLHIISVRPSKQPLLVRTFLKEYMELGSYFLFLQEQIKDIIIICERGIRLHECSGVWWRLRARWRERSSVYCETRPSDQKPDLTHSDRLCCK